MKRVKYWRLGKWPLTCHAVKLYPQWWFSSKSIQFQQQHAFSQKKAAKPSNYYWNHQRNGLCQFWLKRSAFTPGGFAFEYGQISPSATTTTLTTTPRAIILACHMHLKYPSSQMRLQLACSWSSFWCSYTLWTYNLQLLSTNSLQQRKTEPYLAGKSLT